MRHKGDRHPSARRVRQFLLDLGLGTVNGVGLDPSGAPVAGARVGGGLSIVTSGADGRFTLTDVPVGRREIVAVSDALKTRGTTVVDLIRAGDTANATVVLLSLIHISEPTRPY